MAALPVLYRCAEADAVGFVEIGVLRGRVRGGVDLVLWRELEQDAAIVAEGELVGLLPWAGEENAECVGFRGVSGWSCRGEGIEEGARLLRRRVGDGLASD